MDFEQEIDQILKAAPKERRTQLFSATMTSKVAKLQRACLNDPVRIEVASKYSTVPTLRQQYMFIPAKFKDAHLVYLLTELAGATAIIFTRTCDSTRRIALLLRNLGIGAIPIHGQMSQPKRLGALNKFKSGDREILVATDVASRGLDIPSVDVVVNYDVPTNSKDYVHRVGRTARAGRSGRSVTLVTQYDVELFQKIEALIELKMEVYQVDKEAVALLGERVGEAQRIATMQMKESDNKRSSSGGGKGGKRKGTVDDDEVGREMFSGFKSGSGGGGSNKRSHR
jgi:ATP-dependent RNA helicase DDX47/RRP3